MKEKNNPLLSHAELLQLKRWNRPLETRSSRI